MSALDQVVRQGKALYVGISSYSPDATRRAAAILDGLGTRCLIHQPSYSMLNRWVEDGLLDTIQPWTDPTFKVVPARGPLTNGTTVKSFHDMIITVRDRVERLMKEGRSESAVIAQHPTSEFDATWGHGRVPPDDFVHEVYTALKKK